jgi:hypothetical protein
VTKGRLLGRPILHYADRRSTHEFSQIPTRSKPD